MFRRRGNKKRIAELEAEIARLDLEIEEATTPPPPPPEAEYWPQLNWSRDPSGALMCNGKTLNFTPAMASSACAHKIRVERAPFFGNGIEF